MKLSEAIAFATNHEAFIKTVEQKGFHPDDAHQIIASIVQSNPNFVVNRIICDYGAPGPNPIHQDVVSLVNFNRANGTFSLISVH